MNLLNRMISYDKTKVKNQEQCNCAECVSAENADLKNQIIEYPKLSEEEIEQIISERYLDKDDKTKTFIRKALRKHGDRYDYSNTVFIKMKEYVEIICRIKGHKPFPQTPDAHLRGQGCSSCGGNKKLTLEEFIQRAREIHGDKYDYLNVNYININTEVQIICKVHNYKFPQKPSKHLIGHGCPICAIENGKIPPKLTLEEFIKRARIIHNNQYDYSKVEYVNNRTEVIIICNNHNEPYEFPQTPSNHLQGHGCPKCGGRLKLTLKEFIERANKKYGIGRYDYSKVQYININTEIIIICPNHNVPYEFKRIPNSHLIGSGCPLCSESIGASKIRMFLIKNNIKFEREKTFEGCRNVNLLRFDFYLPQYNTCVEFDGECHFQNTNWSGNYTDKELDETLKLYQLRDKIKNEYCENNKINLLRIKYDENVEEKLMEYFQNHGIIQQTLFDL